MSVADKYEFRTELEHIIKSPGMFVGGNEKITTGMFVVDELDDDSTIKTCKIIKKQIEYIPALQRIYEEVLLNAFDQTIRDETCTEIYVEVDQSEGLISVMNNGNGIPVVMKKELGCYIPEMIFGMLRTGSNYDDNQERITGGQNGYGTKLTNIFSTEFRIETVDSTEKKHYKQVWYDNMGRKDSPEIKSAGRKKPFTKVI
jgi:DNA topoisomerase-2